jgi:hypothetical protein
LSSDVTIDKRLKKYSDERKKISKQSKKYCSEAYYSIFSSLSVFAGAYISIYQKERIKKSELQKSLMMACFRLMFNEAYSLHMLATEGYYFIVFRELRFLVEFAKRSAWLDGKMNGKSFNRKLTEYKKREDDKDFRGELLLRQVADALALSPKQEEHIRNMFKRLSSYSHGSTKEMAALKPDKSWKPSFDPTLFCNTVREILRVVDLILFLSAKLNFINKNDVRICNSHRKYFPLSKDILK